MEKQHAEHGALLGRADPYDRLTGSDLERTEHVESQRLLMGHGVTVHRPQPALHPR